MNNVTQCRRIITPIGVLCIVAALAGCDLAMPETGYTPSPAARAAGYPELLTRQQVEAATQGARLSADGAAPGAALAARAAGLRARAAGLSGPVIDPAERARLLAAAQEASARF